MLYVNVCTWLHSAFVLIHLICGGSYNFYRTHFLVSNAHSRLDNYFLCARFFFALLVGMWIEFPNECVKASIRWNLTNNKTSISVKLKMKICRLISENRKRWRNKTDGCIAVACAYSIVKNVFSHIINLFIYIRFSLQTFLQSGKRIKLIRTLLTMPTNSGTDYRCAFLRICHFA